MHREDRQVDGGGMFSLQATKKYVLPLIVTVCWFAH